MMQPGSETSKQVIRFFWLPLTTAMYVLSGRGWYQNDSTVVLDFVSQVGLVQ